MEKQASQKASVAHMSMTPASSGHPVGHTVYGGQASARLYNQFQNRKSLNGCRWRTSLYREEGKGKSPPLQIFHALLMTAQKYTKQLRE